MHGVLSDGGGSGAGTFPVLLGQLLERGHRVDFYGLPGFTHPRSLERYDRYRFIDVNTRGIEGVWNAGNALPTQYPRAAAAQIAIFLCQLEVLRRIDRARQSYDLVLCTDAQQLWRSALPVISWPQSPPHTEAAALRAPHLAEAAKQNWGRRRHAAVLLYYAYRCALARAALNFSDLYVCGSHWARDEWRRFGAAPDQLCVSSYLIDVDAFAGVPPLSAPQAPTFLWLGRATPRKRLDLFLAGFAELKRRHPGVRAKIVGNLAQDGFSAPLLDAADPAIALTPGVPRAEVPSVFAESDVLVQPSENENFGFSVAEALAAGRPVVLGPTNGTLDYADAAGYPFSVYDPRDVADAMERAMRDVAADGAGVSRRARAAATRHFRVEHVVERFEALAHGLVRAGRLRH